MKVKVSTILIVLLVIIPILFFVSCSPKTIIFVDTSNYKEADINISSNAELLSSFKNNSATVTTEDYSSPLKKEIDGLRLVLSPYLSVDNILFIGYDNKEFIENNFLNPDTSNLTLTATDWERAVRILLAFDDKNYSYIKANITDFISEDKIEREDALAGLMNLLALRYSLSLDTDNEDIQKSVVITDLEAIEEKYRPLIIKAFRLGFTDFSVDKSRLFRPNAYLNRDEAISMFYRIFTNLGLPAVKQDDSVMETANALDNISALEQDQEVYSIEDIIRTYLDYKGSLLKSKKTYDKTKLEMLNLTEEILEVDWDSQINKTPLDISTWVYIFNEVFKIDSEEISPYITSGKDDILTYDIASISIFESLYIMGEGKPGDADDKELIAAREAIPQFDTAEDINKFARMYSSGMLEGINKMPGFTPKRPVNSSEALLLIMRIVKRLSIQ